MFLQDEMKYETRVSYIIAFGYPQSIPWNQISNYYGHTPASNLGYLAPPPGQFFMGAKLFIGTPWMRNEGVLKKKLVWAM